MGLSAVRRSVIRILSLGFGVFALLATVDGGGFVFAADVPMPVKAAVKAPTTIPSWTGCYFGAQLGVAQSNARWDYDGLNPYNSPDPAGPLFITEENFHQPRAVIGGQAGCNYSVNGPWMVGVEAGWFAAPMNLTRNNGLEAFPGFTGRVKNEISSVSSLTARFGYSVLPDWLIYAKGGYATAYMRLGGNISPSGLEQFTWRDSHWHHGWTVGTGFEHALFRNVTVGMEYNYYSFGTENYFGAQGGLGAANQVRLNANADVHTLMARLNFYNNTSPAAQVASAWSNTGGTFTSFVNSAVKYSSWSGTRGANVFRPTAAEGFRFIRRRRSASITIKRRLTRSKPAPQADTLYAHQGTPGQDGNYSGPVDTQASFNVVMLNFESVRPQFGVLMNLPTGTPFCQTIGDSPASIPTLRGRQLWRRLQYQSHRGLCGWPRPEHCGLVVRGLCLARPFVREGIDVNTAGTGAFALKQYINPGDVVTANFNITTQVETPRFWAIRLHVGVVGHDQRRGSGPRRRQIHSNLTLNTSIDDRWDIATNVSGVSQEKNEINVGGGRWQNRKTPTAMW